MQNSVFESVTIRRLRAEDGEAAGRIFFDAVNYGTVEYYSAEQREAWAGATANPSAWRDRLRDVDGFMAEIDGFPMGFMTLDSSGYIDLAFVTPRASGRGLGWLLYKAIEKRARQLGIICLTTEASKKAKPFFERQGWIVQRSRWLLSAAYRPLTSRWRRS